MKINRLQSALVLHGKYIPWSSHSLEWYGVQEFDVLSVGFRLRGGGGGVDIRKLS